MARTMGPTTLPEVVLQLRVTQDLSLALNTCFTYRGLYKLLNSCYLLCLCPSRGLAICFFMLRFLLYALWTRLFALWFRRCGMPEQ